MGVDPTVRLAAAVRLRQGTDHVRLATWRSIGSFLRTPLMPPRSEPSSAAGSMLGELAQAMLCHTDHATRIAEPTFVFTAPYDTFFAAESTHVVYPSIIQRHTESATATFASEFFEGGLLRAGGDVNAADYDLRTACHLAASEGNYPSVETLLDHGAKTRAKDWQRLVHERRADARVSKAPRGATAGGARGRREGAARRDRAPAR